MQDFDEIDSGKTGFIPEADLPKLLATQLGREPNEKEVFLHRNKCVDGTVSDSVAFCSCRRYEG